MSPTTSTNALGDFLRARRERLSPSDVGLVPSLSPRRTPGLRREEVAVLAGLSENYYTRLERGREKHPSPAAVEALARTLRLTPEEHAYLRTVAARAAGSPPIPTVPRSDTVQPSVPFILESLRPFAAYVVNRTGDILSTNPAGAVLFPGMNEWESSRRNISRYLFLHPAVRTLYPDTWGQHAQQCITGLRSLAGTDPDDPDLTELLTELMAASPDFVRLWQNYDVRPHSDATKVLHHPLTGPITLNFQALMLVGSPSHRLSVYYAPPGTEAHAALQELDSAGHED